VTTRGASGGHQIRTEVRNAGNSRSRLTYHARCICGWHSTACKDIHQASQQAAAHLALHATGRFPGGPSGYPLRA
jgi:protein-disulfide isomerase-like protein with CxxC motif